MNTLCNFRKCNLTDTDLIAKVDALTDEMFIKGKVPNRCIPAQPDSDYDLLIGELLLRYDELKEGFLEQQKKIYPYFFNRLKEQEDVINKGVPKTDNIPNSPLSQSSKYVNNTDLIVSEKPFPITIENIPDYKNYIESKSSKDESNSEFRIKEYNGEFQIQRKRIETIIKGTLWWKKSKEVVTWEYVDKYGRFLLYFKGTPLNIKDVILSFSTLELAKTRLNLIKEGAKYHY